VCSSDLIDRMIGVSGMTSTQVRTPPTQGRRTPGLASVRDDIVGALLGVALIGGVLTDAWAHTNILKPDSGFFTP